MTVGAVALVAAAGAQQPSEYELKAAFLYNFTKFTEWPSGAFESGDASFRICVIGDDPFGPVLDELVAGESAAGRPIRVVRHRRLRDAASCQVAFVAADQNPAALAELPGVSEGMVFTVGESEEFLAAGGLLRFRLQRGRIRLEVNDEARSRLRLKISSKLLQLAELVRPSDRRERR